MDGSTAVVRGGGGVLGSVPTAVWRGKHHVDTHARVPPLPFQHRFFPRDPPLGLVRSSIRPSTSTGTALSPSLEREETPPPRPQGPVTWGRVVPAWPSSPQGVEGGRGKAQESSTKSIHTCPSERHILGREETDASFEGRARGRSLETKKAMLAWMGGTRRRLDLGKRGKGKPGKETHATTTKAACKHVGASTNGQKRKRTDQGMSKDVKRLKLKVHPAHTGPCQKKDCSNSIGRALQPSKTEASTDNAGAASHERRKLCTDDLLPRTDSHASDEPQAIAKQTKATDHAPRRTKQIAGASLKDLMECQQAAEGMKQDLAKRIIGECKTRVRRVGARTEGYATLLPRQYCR